MYVSFAAFILDLMPVGAVILGEHLKSISKLGLGEDAAVGIGFFADIDNALGLYIDHFTGEFDIGVSCGGSGGSAGGGGAG